MYVDPAKAAPSRDPRVGATVYILHGLLQRLERQQPGLLDSMIEGALRDRAALVPEDSVAAAHACQIAEEALQMLRLMSEQLYPGETLRSTDAAGKQST